VCCRVGGQPLGGLYAVYAAFARARHVCTCPLEIRLYNFGKAGTRFCRVYALQDLASCDLRGLQRHAQLMTRDDGGSLWHTDPVFEFMLPTYEHGSVLAMSAICL
jgi:hypothetical protein